MRPSRTLVPACLVLCGCTAADEVSVVRLDLSGCLLPATPGAAGCGDALVDRFAGVGGGAIPACLAVAPAAGGAAATLALGVSPLDGALRPRGADAVLPLPGAGGELAFKLFVLDDPDEALCQPGLFHPDRACDGRLPRCLIATRRVVRPLGPGGTLDVAFGGDADGAQACDFECNDRCAPGDPACVSVCHQADPADGAAGAREACDGRDNDCDGLVDEGCDGDRDGFCATGVPLGDGAGCDRVVRDCDDGDPDIKPTAAEVCDGVDNDCDGRTDVEGALEDAPLCPRQAGACALAERRCADGAYAEGCGAQEYGPSWDGETEERCGDGQDNDCDGRVDAADPDCECWAGDAPRACSFDLGACREGVSRCVPRDDGGGEGFVFGPCDGVVRRPEECDGADDDCDGATDEGLVAGEADAACPDLGVCAGRPTVCRGGAWRCDHPGAFEAIEASCDGLDNDCDGRTDEDLSPPAGLDVCPVDGVCSGEGVEAVCDPGLGRWRCGYAAAEFESEEVSCDSLDNDCDGLADEGCPCDPGATLACGADAGACEAGVQECDGGRWGPCVGAVGPVLEVCDGADNDCDGSTDEGLVPERPLCPDAGICADRPTVCRAGAWVCDADGRQDAETVCDGLDNDCDGAVDEPADLLPPDRPLCPDRGVCAGRGSVCAGGGWACDRPDTYEPDETRCDGLDNDCDGVVDEPPLAPPAERPCPSAGVCAAAPVRCAQGRWTCELPEAFEEVEGRCDGLDNDCDDAVDEAPEGGGSLVEPCYEDTPETAGVGVCRPGLYLCVGGDWDESECVGQVRPGFEECDGEDDDCDGLTDERPVGEGPLARPCYTGPQATRGQGVCADGRQVCVDGQFAEDCPGEVLPGVEVCDGRDLDCNGLSDDLPDITCGVGRCANTVAACADGADNVCAPHLDRAVGEDCNGQDDDCNGVVDDARPVTCGEGRCEVAVAACVGGRDAACVPDDAAAREEVCDGVDDDCDGQTDEASEEGAPLLSDCYDGRDGTEGVGSCRGGVRVCDAGEFGACDGQVLPSEEGCFAQDRDCDGQLDNGPTGALAVSGDGGRAVLPGGQVLGRGDFTVEAWVRRAADAGGAVVAQGQGAPALSLSIDAGTGALSLRLDAGAEAAGGEVPEGAWTHVAGVRVGPALRVYVDGVPAGEGVVPTDLRLDPDGADLRVGDGFEGLLDEVRITRGARYGSLPFVPTERLEADLRTAHLWRFDEAAGNVAADAAAAGAPLHLTGGAGWAVLGPPHRGVFFADGDGDGAGGGGDVLRSCGPPGAGWSATPGDCDDGDGGVGAPEPEVLGNGRDDDCDGRADPEDGVQAVELTAPGAFLHVAGAQQFSLRATDWTVDAWVFLTGWGDRTLAPLISVRNSAGQGADGWTLAAGGLGGPPARARRLVLVVDDEAGEHVVASDRELPLGRWVHVAATFARATATARLWVDGQAAGVANLVAMPFGRPVLSIGRDHSLGDADVHCLLDDLRVSTVLRFAAPFDPPLCPAPDADTLALWRFEEGQGAFLGAGAAGSFSASRQGNVASSRSDCEDKGPPAADCEALTPHADEVCRDEPGRCVARADAGEGSCDAWCAAAGLLCAGAYAADAACVPDAPLPGGCAEPAEEVLCACSR